jgi:hypothetical protein
VTSLSPILNHMPAIEIAYGVSGLLCGLLGFCGRVYKVLAPLGAILLLLAILNRQVENSAANSSVLPWSPMQGHRFAIVALLLMVCFLTLYTLFCISLMERATQSNNAGAAFVSSYLIVVYPLVLGLALALPELLSSENPYLSLYLFLGLICVIHVPCFAQGKTQLLKSLKEHKVAPSPQIHLSPASVRYAIVALGAPLLVVFLQAVKDDDWRLFVANAIIAVALASLLLISQGLVRTAPVRERVV